jgi:hypothetical protein
VEPELSPGVHLKNTRAAPNIFLYFVKKKKNEPLAAFPPSVRLKEHQTKHTSFIFNRATTVQEISWQDFWRSHAPRGARVVTVDA